MGRGAKRVSVVTERERVGWGLGQRKSFLDISGEGMTEHSPGGRRCLQEGDSGVLVGSVSGRRLRSSERWREGHTRGAGTTLSIGLRSRPGRLLQRP